MPKSASKNVRTWAAVLLLAIVGLFAVPVTAQKPVNKNRPKVTQTNSGAAAVTGEYRSPGKLHKLSVSNNRQLAQSLQSQGARVIADYGSFVLFEVNDTVARSVAGAAGTEIVDENNLVLLNAGSIDTKDQKSVTTIARKVRQADATHPVCGTDSSGMVQSAARHGCSHRDLHSEQQLLGLWDGEGVTSNP